MAYKCEKELREKAGLFIEKLEKEGIKGALLETSFCDYRGKIYITKADRIYGTVILYYSPARDLYTMKLQGLEDFFIVPELEKCWYGKTLCDYTLPGRSYHIYVCGSFLNNSTGYGSIILRAGITVKEFYGVVPDYSGSHKFVGELFALRETLKWCRKHGADNISVFYNYEGVEKWATGEWPVKGKLIQKYKKFIETSGLKLFWHKSDITAGDRWNERAKELAEKGPGVC